MKKRTLLTAALSGAFLLGCAYQFPKDLTTAQCTGNACRVSVDVAEHEIGGCKPYPTPDTLSVAVTGATVIKWDMELLTVRKGYRFPANGIVFDDASQFECSGPAEDGKQFVCTDKNSQPGTYKYTVNVVKGSTPCTANDPYIINR